MAIRIAACLHATGAPWANQTQQTTELMQQVLGQQGALGRNTSKGGWITANGLSSSVFVRRRADRVDWQGQGGRRDRGREEALGGGTEQSEAWAKRRERQETERRERQETHVKAGMERRGW